MGRQNKISEIHRLYGKFIVDFANSKSSDEAGTRFFENMKLFLDFPDRILNKDIPEDENRFPTIKDFKSSFNQLENELLELKTKERQILSEITPIIDNGEFRYKGYDVSEKALIYDRIVYLDGGYDYDGKPYLDFEVDGTDYFDADHIKKYFSHLCSASNHRDSEAILAGLITNIESLMNTGTSINSLKNTLSKKRYQQMIDVSEYYDGLLSEHAYIDLTKERLKRCLTLLIGGKNEDLQVLRELLDQYATTYNEIAKEEASVTRLGEINFTNYFDSVFYIQRFGVLPELSFEDYYNQPVSYCLIEFMKDSQNVKHLKQCSKCNNVFIRDTLRIERTGRYFCSDKCRLNFHNEINIKSGKHAEYKRKKRKEGAKESYYG
jgi:hypothetical protein